MIWREMWSFSEIRYSRKIFIASFGGNIQSTPTKSHRHKNNVSSVWLMDLMFDINSNANTNTHIQYPGLSSAHSSHYSDCLLSRHCYESRETDEKRADGKQNETLRIYSDDFIFYHHRLKPFCLCNALNGLFGDKSNDTMHIAQLPLS